MNDINDYSYFFDFDGVLVDSMPIKTEAFRVLFAPYGAEAVSRVVAYHRQHGGISRVDKIRHSHARFLGRPLSDAELQDWAGRYARLVHDQVVAADWVDGAREFLDTVHRRCLVFVVSGTPETELAEVIEQRGMGGYFTEVLGSPPRKPELIRGLLERYRLDPTRCIFIGDALTDYEAAKETGLHFIGIQGEVSFPDDAIVLPDCTGLRSTVEQRLPPLRQDGP